MTVKVQSPRTSKTALVTGASSGIGLEIARCFARDGHDLVLVARNEQALRDVAQQLGGERGVSVTVLPKDLSKADAPNEIYEETAGRAISIHFLVNNAGFAQFGPFVESDLDQDLAVVQLNMASMTHLTRLFLPAMVARHDGKILNVASTAAFQPGPLMAIYYASKAYVLSFSEAIADELHGTGVTVTALCPGPTQTPWKEKAGAGDLKLTSGKLMDAATVAHIGYRAMMRGKRLVIAGFKNQVMMWGAKLSPRSVPLAVVRRLHQRVQ